MTQFVYGKIIEVDDKKRLIALRDKRRIRRFYLARGLFAAFSAYLKPGIYIFLTCQADPKRYHGSLVFSVVHIDKLMLPNRQQPQLFYDVSKIKSGIRTILNRKRPKLFLDLEMSMPPYRNYEHFVSEIIQAGLVLTDSEGNVLLTQSMFIRPNLYPKISDRTVRFLHLRQEEIDNGISIEAFIELLKKIEGQHRPMIFVWGQNDQLELFRMNERVGGADFLHRMQFFDLLKLHKTYFGLKNDLGLFNAYNMYFEEPLDNQRHDAFQDAEVTKAIFFGFKDVANGKKQVVLPNSTTPEEGNGHVEKTSQ